MILMDTCAIIWDALQKDRLTKKAKTAISKADKNAEILICDISIWEIAMLVKRKRLEIDDTAANLVRLFLESRNVTVVPISPEIAELSVNLGPEINNDPADRIIVATSIIKQAPLITADSNLRDARIVETLW
jgi:PIN domain nuclease of toxin-antitoxin system